MQIESTSLSDCYIIRPRVFEDERGFFMETFNQKLFEQVTGLSGHFVQDNQSLSRYGVIRGLHMQKPPFEQAKLVRVVQGRILDVAVDIRERSATFGKWFAIELSAENKCQLYIPRGCLHGFSVLSEDAVVAYKADEFYAPSHELGLHYADPFFNISWQVPETKVVISEKDMALPYIEKVHNFIPKT